MITMTIHERGTGRSLVSLQAQVFSVFLRLVEISAPYVQSTRLTALRNFRVWTPLNGHSPAPSRGDSWK